MNKKEWAQAPQQAPEEEEEQQVQEPQRTERPKRKRIMQPVFSTALNREHLSP